MIGSKLRVLLAFACLFSVLVFWVEPYFPDGVYYRSKLKTAFTSFNKNLVNLEREIRIGDPSLLDTQNLPVPVRKFAIWDSLDKTGSAPEFETLAIKQLLIQAWEGKTSRLLNLEGEPVFFVPIYDKQLAVLAVLDKDKFYFDVEGRSEYFFPELKIGSFKEWGSRKRGADPIRISEDLLLSLKENGNDFQAVTIGETEYRAYYLSFPENQSAFIQGFFLLVPEVNSKLLMFFPLLFAALLTLDLAIFFLRRRSTRSLHKNSDIARLTKLLSERIAEETLKKIESARSSAPAEIPSPSPPVYETVNLSGDTFYVLPFDLPKDSFLTPKFLREPKHRVAGSAAYPIPELVSVAEPSTDFVETIQRKRDSIFTDELARLVDKVRSGSVEEIPATEEKPKDSGLLAKALRVSGLAEIGLKAARGIALQHKSRFFLWARAWWGIRKTDPNEEIALSERFRTWLDEQPIREKRKVLEVLDEIHQGLDSSSSSLLKYYLTIFSSYHLKSFTIHFYDRRKGAYLPVVTSGMQPYTRQNMIFLYGDQFLGEENNQVSIIDVTEERRNDHFFRKKFDPADLDGVIRIVSFPLFKSGLDFRFFLLFPDPPNSDFADRILESVERSIDPVEEAFLQLEIEHASHAIQDKRDLVQIQFLLLRWATHGERSRCNLFKIRLKGQRDYDSAEKWRKTVLERVQPLLGAEDYAFGVSPSEIFVLSREEMKESLSEILEQTGESWEIVPMPYPEGGKNLYTYI
ncbi:hypothetical protein EHO60_06455 [Leptospira fletcheri]|uniref:Uncharacterized protein n=1 Tax=Leptospira fletcheri TaxID=2484981 RepID=A0A4R9GIM6_9LEPT|nr:hypothetical protein [Leptospira fletcheri]TGK11923.1 hypothetical protein EHO60_06455 [Leptospira fletcheri]